MKIFSIAQIKEWDSYTINHESINSIDLMERAAMACFEWIAKNYDDEFHFNIFCGRGNNGGDGLAIARLLESIRYKVSVFVPYNITSGSKDFEANLKKLKKTSATIVFLKETDPFPSFTKTDIIVDAIFGTGLNKRPTGFYARLINFINSGKQEIISIDVPSGLYIDTSSKNLDEIIRANYTLTFQNQKLAFLVAENAGYSGKVFLLNIGLSKEFEKNEEARLEYIDEKLVSRIYHPRNEFTHKGNYGYACLLAGSEGMMGAAILSATACLRSGVGKLTCFICEAGYTIMQTSVPEAMVKICGEKYIKGANQFHEYDVVGIGPGIGKYESHKELLEKLFIQFKKPIVIDADALNILSENQYLYQLIPQNSIITPHPKEFERLFGKVENDFERIDLALAKAKELSIIIILKGHHTLIATPDGKAYFNSTGNSGMATAGAGDVLTGIVTGLLAQKYSPLNASILGVYLHGLAGDMAAESISKEALIAGDIIRYMGRAFKEISKTYQTA